MNDFNPAYPAERCSLPAPFSEVINGFRLALCFDNDLTVLLAYYTVYFANKSSPQCVKTKPGIFYMALYSYLFMHQHISSFTTQDNKGTAISCTLIF
jgi:hypothetical protein